MCNNTNSMRALWLSRCSWHTHTRTHPDQHVYAALLHQCIAFCFFLNIAWIIPLYEVCNSFSHLLRSTNSLSSIRFVMGFRCCFLLAICSLSIPKMHSVSLIKFRMAQRRLPHRWNEFHSILRIHDSFDSFFHLKFVGNFSLRLALCRIHSAAVSKLHPIVHEIVSCNYLFGVTDDWCQKSTIPIETKRKNKFKCFAEPKIIICWWTLRCSYIQ